MLLLFNIRRPRRLIELSNVTQMASRTLAENSRCFASTWTLRKDEVVYELCERLNTMGIEPLGALEHTSTMVEKRIWRVSVEDAVVADSAIDGLQTGLF